MEPHTLMKLCMALGMGSIIVSMLLWPWAKGRSVDEKASAERRALFVGLWAPSMLALATYFTLMAR